MSTRVIMPKQGLQMTEGRIIKWLVSEGDLIEKSQPLFEMETDKLTITVDSPADGTLLKIVRKNGDVVPITELVAVIGSPGEDISDLIEDGQTQKAPQGGETARVDGAVFGLVAMEEGAPFQAETDHPPGRVRATPRARTRAAENKIDIQEIRGTGSDGLVIERDVLHAEPSAQKLIGARATPLARKIAALESIDLASVTGTGSGGKITRSDVERRAGQPAAGTAVGGRTGKLIPLTGMRSGIARKMLDSLHVAAQANHRMNVDMAELLRTRGRLKDNGVKVSVTDMLVRVVAKALVDHPIINSTWTDEGILLLDDVNIGIAVAVDNGLLVPVVRNAEKLGLVKISSVTSGLIQRTKSGTVNPDELEGGTFTITNLGMFDIDSFTAIINQPESAILAVGKINKSCVVIDDQPAIRPIATLSLTYDHRVIDGATAAQFLQTIKKVIENPYLLI